MSGRKGITPVVAVVLLLMMTVAAAGAAYTWFTQMQERLQGKAMRDLRQEVKVKDLRCNAGSDTIEIAIQNSGDTQLNLGDVNVFVRDSTGHLNSTLTDLDWTGEGFSQPGGFGTVTVDISNSETGSDFLAQGAFYNIEIGITNSDLSITAGGCLAQ
ncbi:MAG: archaellin/type IV pilin N-terminal domain-containing protein [Candidatus Nanohaloarchaea archaeon]|nr:archaellin/type IV pilin N-terminal domain-containing protein [Candidatus Nanohaloarchaea archaeon]